jgi:AcrR family transcriptional regulator
MPCKLAESASLDEMQGFSERMMTVASTAPPTGPPASLRERKKLATRRLLRRVALELAAERGAANVTVEDIAEAADVSPRTFFNYFPSKEAAMFGSNPDQGMKLRERIALESPGEPALEALRAVMIAGAGTVVEDLRELGGDPADWLRRMKTVRKDPHLRAAHTAQMANLERTITEALAQRLGTDPDRDPYPGLLCAVAVGAFRNSVTSWAASGGTVPLERLIDLSFRALADGLPEDCELRQITGNVTDRKDDH